MEKKTFSVEDTSAVKGVAILFMLFHHCFLSSERWKDYEIVFFPLPQESTVMIANFFKICVAMFVFLTGYGITKSMIKIENDTTMINKRKLIESATINRLLKLMFGYWFIFIFWHLFSLFNQIFSFASTSWSFKRVYGSGKRGFFYAAIDFFGLADIFGTPTFNGTWWYMSLAIVLILIMPLMFKLHKKFGFIVTMAVAIVPKYLGMETTPVTRYILALSLGIICSLYDILPKMKDFSLVKNFWINKILKFIPATLLLVVMFFLRQQSGEFLSTFVEVFDGIIPVFFIYYLYEFVIYIPVLRQCLCFIGKYSMDIFLLHTFIRCYYFEPFTYSFKYPWLIALILLANSLLIAVFFEWLKKLTKYNLLSEKVRKKLAAAITA